MSRFKTELCNNLIELGSCKYGDRCHYAHGVHELRQVSKRHPKYRTEKCKNFELTGKCPFGPRCSYVHPKPDLDSMIDQLTKYMKHTKAPKPDSENDDDLSIFTRTNSSISISRDSMNTNDGRDEHNKENLDLVLNLKNSIHQKPSEYLFNRSHPLTNFTNGATNGNNRNNISMFEPPSYESNKKSHLISTESSFNSNNAIASNPFGINNPLSDILKNSNIDGRSPLNPNRQYYTRF